MADKTVVVRIVVRANQFSSGLRGAAAKTQRFAVDVERSSAKAGSSALALGAASATAGKLILVGIGGAMVVSAKAAIDFESSLAGVAKTTDLTGSAFAKAGSPLAAFGESLRSLSMRIPLNVNELARIAEVGGQLGIQVPNLIEFTEVMAALGVSTNLAATEAATGLARFANIMGTAQNQFGRLGDVIVELGNNLPTTESEILGFALRLAPVGRTIGLTEEEVLGLGAAMTSLGVRAERGGTALQRLFLDMQTAVLGGGEALQKFAAATRMSSEEFEDLFRESPALAFLELVKQLDATTDAGGNAAGVLESIGVIQQRSIQVLLASASGWETVADSLNLANEAGEAGTALQEEAARRYGTSASQIQILGNAFNDLRIEIGNALLGSGGLAAGLDFLREFIRLIKDNLPLIGRLTKVLLAVAAIRIGAGILLGLKAALVTLRGIEGAAWGAARGTAALRLGMLGVNTAVFAGLGIAAILITRWAAMAAKAAELRRAGKEFLQDLEEGTPPVEAFLKKLRDQGVLTDEISDRFHNLGISVEDFVTKLLEGDEGLTQFLAGDFDKDILGRADAMATFAKTFGTTKEEIGALFPSIAEAQIGILGLTRFMRESSEIFRGGALAERARQIREGLIEAGKGAIFTTEQLKIMADRAAVAFDLSVPVGDIIRQMTTDYQDAALRGEVSSGIITDSLDDITFSWRELVNQTEDGESRIENFFETMISSVDDFEGTLSDSFDEVREAILGSFPAWDEYEQATIESLDAVIAAQDAYLEDLRDGLGLQQDLVGQVSRNVLEFVENLDPATKGALARFRKSNREGFEEWLADVGENLDEAGELVIDFWELKLPEGLSVGFRGLLATAAKEAKSLELPGRQTAESFFEGLSAQMILLSGERQQEYLDAIEEALSDQGFMDALGFGVGDDVIEGLLRALRNMAARANPIFLAQAQMMQENVERVWGVHSPSTVMEDIGKDITRGLFEGLNSEFDRQFQDQRSSPIVNILGPKPVVNLTTTVQGGSRDINLYYPHHTSDDVISGVKTASVLTSLQREAEVAIGPG